MRSVNPEPENKFHAPLIIVSGPSGVGKTTVVDRLLANTRLPLRRAITATTRPVRPGETDGISYHFWTVEQFLKARDTGRMLEWEIVHGKDYYGTPREEVDSYRQKGTGVILVIDVKGAASIRILYPNDNLSVFIDAPFVELENRLRMRAAEPEERIQERLKSAREEIVRAAEFDCTIINRDLDRAVIELEQILETKFYTPKPR
jgi:guanylate kinase